MTADYFKFLGRLAPSKNGGLIHWTPVEIERSSLCFFIFEVTVVAVVLKASGIDAAIITSQSSGWFTGYSLAEEAWMDLVTL